MRTITRVFLLAFLLDFFIRPAGAADVGGGAPVPGDDGLVEIELFSESGCAVCERLRREVLPEFEQRYAGGYRWVERDIAVSGNYLRLVSWLRKLGAGENPAVLVVVDGREALAGFEAIRDGLAGAMERAITARLEGLDKPAGVPDGQGTLRRYVREFTLVGILAAAAVDSINPCMVATLVFFLSLLSVAHMGARRMALAGGAFVVACYITYFLLGFGLLSGLKALTAVRWIRPVLDLALVVLLVVLAVLSFVDAVQYHRTGQARSVLLKLPGGLQHRIHEVMKRGLRTPHLVAGGFGVGALVTLMESVCTGQVYVPALALMIRSGQSVARCLAYLFLYNLIFVLPLVLLLGLTCAGVGTPVLVEWSRRNVVFSKVLLGLFFAGMAAMMIVLR